MYTMMLSNIQPKINSYIYKHTCKKKARKKKKNERDTER